LREREREKTVVGSAPVNGGTVVGGAPMGGGRWGREKEEMGENCFGKFEVLFHTRHVICTSLVHLLYIIFLN